MALFGLSPLFLSVIASTWFTDPVSGSLNVTHFTAFLSVFLGFTYLLGAITLRVDADAPVVEPPPQDSDDEQADETTSLLPDRRKPSVSLPSETSVLSLLRQSDFWLIAVFCVFTLGAVSPISALRTLFPLTCAHSLR